MIQAIDGPNRLLEAQRLADAMLEAAHRMLNPWPSQRVAQTAYWEIHDAHQKLTRLLGNDASTTAG